VRRPPQRRGVHVSLRSASLTAAVGALLIAGCGGAAHRAHQRAVASAVPSLPPVLGQATPKAPVLSRVPPLTALQVSLGRLFAKAGPASGAEVYDLTARAQVFSLRAATGRPPASVEKLYTSLTALRDFGPNAAFQTRILGAGHLGPHGVWFGDLYLKGGGDPTFGDGTFNQVWNHGFGPTPVELVAQLKAHGITAVTGKVIGDESLFDSARGGPATNYAPDVGDFGGQLSALTYDHGATQGALTPPEFAAKQLVATMRAQHIKAKADTATGITPPGAQTLATVTSPPLSTLLSLMDVPSDDLFAEILTKQLGVRFGDGQGQISSGAKVISSVLSTYGLHPTVVDGSGLSRSDTSSPGEVVSLLRQIWRTPIGDELSDALPVVGVSGTVQTIGVHTPAQGRCIAKTGTLNDVTNLAGYCTNGAKHVLAFALFLDGPPNWVAEKTLSQMVGAIAR
jgi:serine-type D-Ala-D-Ala carboxypeptidase/endopeptidase (penicillin-binding protein 4)